jgi:hypothetical protein
MEDDDDADAAGIDTVDVPRQHQTTCVVFLPIKITLISCNSASKCCKQCSLSVMIL